MRRDRCAILGRRTTLDIYLQFVPESQQRVVNKLSSLGLSVN